MTGQQIVNDLGRIYLDTNVLLDGNWPAVGPLLEDILRLASQLQIPVLIPAPVEEEVEMVWLRKMFEARRAFEGRGSGVLRGETPPLSWDLIREDYKAAVAKVKTKWGIGTPSFPRQSLADAFLKCISRKPPYASLGGEFRDTVIYLSVVEDMDKAASAGVLVTRDSGLKGAVEQRNADPDNGPHRRLIVLDGLSSLRRDLSSIADTRLSGEELAWKRHNDNVVSKTFLGEEKPKLEAYIRNHIEFPSELPLKMLSWSAEVIGAHEISTTATRATTDGTRVSISADIEVRVRGLMQPRIFLNQGPHQTGWHLGSAGLYDIHGNVAVQATAVYHPDHYADIVFESSELSSWNQIGPAPLAIATS